MNKKEEKIKFTPEQERAYTHDDSDLIVAASAGAGKTQVLIEYIFDKVAKSKNGEKVSINEILAMTFTEPAANSMKKKLFQRMNQALTPEEKNKGYDSDHLKKEAELLPSADICTIDAFCANILNQYCYILGWDPKRPKTVLDANTVKELKQQAAKEVVLENIKKNKDFYDLALFYTSNGNSTYTLQNMLISVSDNIDKYADKEKWFDIIRSYYSKTKFNDLDQNIKDFFYTSALDLVESVRAKFVACYEAIKDHQEISSTINAVQQYIKDIDGVIEKINDQDERVFDELGQIKTPETTYYKAKKSDSNYNEVDELHKIEQSLYRDYRNDIKNDIDKFAKYAIQYNDFPNQNKILKDRVELFLNVLNQYRALVDQKMGEMNGIDFVEMERAAIEILENKDIAQRVRNRYKYILIDEYQDTNDIQERLVKLICRDNPGNVFRVGDIKQSIYGFRSAKPELMKQILIGAKEEEKVVFKDNFRSSNNIIQFNNLLYKTLMNIPGFNDTFTDEVDVAKTEVPDKIAVKEKCEINLLSYPLEEKNIPINTKRVDEARYVATKIKKMREASIEKKKQTEKEWSKLDPAKQKEYFYNNGIFADWKDYVILVKNHDHKLLFENVFEAFEVPLFFVINKGYYEDVAVQTVMAWLKWLSNINDEIAMFSVFTSPFYEKTNNDLASLILDYKNSDNKKNRLDFILSKYDDIKKDYDYLKNTYEQEGVIKLLQEIFNLNNYYYTKTTSEQRDNLALFFEKCVSVNDRYYSIDTLINWLDINQKADDGTATSVSENSDVVRIFTIHKSKGLEYPVVIYMPYSLKRKRSENSNYRIDEKLGFAMKIYKAPYNLNYEPLLWDVIDQKRHKDALEEEIRLMYVATTRAISKLIVVSLESDEKVDFNAAGITKIAHKDEAIGNMIRDAISLNSKEFEKYCEVNHLTTADIPDEKQISQKVESEPFELRTYENKTEGYVEKKPSDLEKKSAYPISYEDKVDGALRGTLIHKAYELLDFANPKIEDLNIPLSDDDKKKIINFFNHDIGKKIAKMDNIIHELPYAFMKDGEYMHGYMDLVAMDDKEIILVDYKSDLNKTKEEFIEAYEGQQKAYRMALESFGLPIACYLYSLELDEFIEIS